jgi:hypothetical protein
MITSYPLFFIEILCVNLQLKDAVIHGTASDVEFTMLEALKLIVLELLGAEQVYVSDQSISAVRTGLRCGLKKM